MGGQWDGGLGVEEEDKEREKLAEKGVARGNSQGRKGGSAAIKRL